MSHDGIAHAIRFYKPKEKRLSDLPEGDEKDALRRAKWERAQANGQTQSMKLQWRYGTLELFNATKATLTWARNSERGETPKDAADMGKGPAWEEFL